MVSKQTKNILTKAFKELYPLVCNGRWIEIDAYLQTKPYGYVPFMALNELKDEHINLLMVAALNGHDRVVRIALRSPIMTKTRVELEGSVRDSNGYLRNKVTALWCALDRGHFQVARTLIDIGGADINHGSRWPLLLEAIILGRLDIVHFLVENGYANPNQSIGNNMNGINGLFICAIKGRQQIAEYLISRGANIHSQTLPSRETPMHHAAKYGHSELLRLLLLSGSDPHSKTTSGKSSIVLAAQFFRTDTVKLLLHYIQDSIVFDDLEPAATSFLVSNGFANTQNRSGKMFRLLKMSLAMRKRLWQPKIVAKPIQAYDHQKECEFTHELNRIQHDEDRLYTEALLIRERILLPQRNEELFEPLLQRVILFAQRAEFDRSLNLMLHTFRLYQAMGLPTSLHCFVWLFCKMIIGNVPIRIDQFLEVCRLVFEPSPKTHRDANVVNTTCLVALAVKVLEQNTITDQDRHSIIVWIKQLCKAQYCTNDGYNLLHVTVDFETGWKINYRSVDIGLVLSFPNLGAARLLVCYGKRWLDLNAREHITGNTALHLISRSYRYDNRDKSAIIELLIKAGAHIDCVNLSGNTPADLAIGTETFSLLSVKAALPRLKCLCSRMIVDHSIVCDDLWPASTEMNSFIHLHGTKKRRRFV